MSINRTPVKIRLALMSGALFAVVLASSAALVAWLPLPTYGTWTGIAPLEAKLEALEDFAQSGDIDALVLGSSIADFGFNAQLFSQLMSTELGRPFRAFNMSTGGAELRTLPKLYRLARTVCKPKSVYILHPVEPKLSEELVKDGPDDVLRMSQAGAVLDQPQRLQSLRSRRGHMLLRKMPAIRNFALQGNFQGNGFIENFAVDANGDRISYHVTQKARDLPIHRRQSLTWVPPYPASPDITADSMQQKAEFHFASVDINAVRELRKLVEGDGGTLRVFAHGSASTLWQGLMDNAQYRKVRQDFFESLAWIAGVPLVDAAGRANVRTHSVSDVTHLNAYGAATYTRAAFAAFTGKAGAPPDDDLRSPPDDVFAVGDPSSDLHAALIRRPAHQAHSTLHIRLVPSMPALRSVSRRVTLLLRTPDNVDIVATVTRLDPYRYVAEVNLPPADRPEGYILRLVMGKEPRWRALALSVAGYQWVDASRADGPATSQPKARYGSA